MCGINPDFDYLFDDQQSRPKGLCVNCGAEIYDNRADLCHRCREYENDLEELS